MTPEQFVYWLQGYSEVAKEIPTKEQWLVIQDHLQTVFKKETPYRSGGAITIPPQMPYTPNGGAGTFPEYPHGTVIC